ncbi:conserved hypothetical protein [Trichinella spiralis]|uniref:hypothetical protein n=1 Tax=Trichinella spiralis TaxID=6334 RepID=UPI0001EFB216|nr:conserved hypothetical protein [Trichinella spiralis]
MRKTIQRSAVKSSCKSNDIPASCWVDWKGYIQCLPVVWHQVKESEQGLNVRHMYVDFSYSTYMWTVSIGIHSIRLVNGGTTFSRYDNHLLEDQHEHIDKLKN